MRFRVNSGAIAVSLAWTCASAMAELIPSTMPRYQRGFGSRRMKNTAVASRLAHRHITTPQLATWIKVWQNRQLVGTRQSVHPLLDIQQWWLSQSGSQSPATG